MSKYDYYTPLGLAKKLVQLIPNDKAIKSIADICCGTWNLLTAAHERFPSALLTGVDVNPNVKENIIAGATFVAGDGRDFANEMYKNGSCFDLLLSNPPFGPLSLSQKKYSGKECVQQYKRYESELLYANYILLDDNGYLLVILPVTYAKGDKYKSHRLWISNHFEVMDIVELPTDTFGSKSLHTVALILKKSSSIQKNCARVYLASYNQGNWFLDKKQDIESTNILSGDWFSGEKNCDLKLDIFRGNISSHFFCENGDPVIHCSSTVTNGMWEPSIRMCKFEMDIRKKYVEAGDIIINRVGRNAGAWKIYLGPTSLVSDCIIVIKKPAKAIIRKLEQHSVEGVLRVPRLGVSTPYISSKQINSLLAEVRK